MHLPHPTAVFWLGLALPIVALAVVRMRRRRARVATALEQPQSLGWQRPPSAWWRWCSLLGRVALVGLLLFVSVAFIARTELWAGRRVVLVIDNSASMNARDVAPTRLAEAKRRAGTIIDALRSRDRVAIVTAATEPRLVCPMTGRSRAVREALAAVAASDGPTRVAESVAVARRLLANRPNKTVVVISDGAFDGAERLAEADDVDFVRVGEARTGNVGITRFHVERSPGDLNGYEIRAEVVNASDAPASCRITIRLNDQVIDCVPLSLEPGDRWSRTFRRTSMEGGRVVAALDAPDSLTADNQAWAILPRGEPQRVTLVTGGGLLVDEVFAALPLVRLTTTTDLNLPSTRPGGIAVFYRTVPSRLPPGPVIVIEPTRSNELWAVGEPIVSHAVAAVDDDSPLLAHVPLEKVAMPGARKLTFKARANVLATARHGEPLYAIVERPAGNVYVLIVNPEKADPALRTALPILLTNALAAIAGPKAELRAPVTAGRRIEVDAARLAPTRGAPGLILQAPNGAMRPLTDGTTRMRIGPLDQCGIWCILRRPARENPRVQNAPELELACNLANPRESDLRAPDHLRTARADATFDRSRASIASQWITLAWLFAGIRWSLLALAAPPRASKLRETVGGPPPGTSWPSIGQ